MALPYYYGSPTADWPRGGLPMGPSAYEDAMKPIYDEVVWRERNFYKANEDAPPEDESGGSGETSPEAIPATPDLVATVTQPFKDFGDFLMPSGQAHLPRILLVAGGLLVLGIFIGSRK